LVFIEKELEINLDRKKRIRIWFISYKDCAPKRFASKWL